MNLSVIYIRLFDEIYRERVLNVSETFTEDHTVLGLQPNRLYHFRVVANNNNGPGRSSDDFTVVTEAEVNVPGPPVGINVMSHEVFSVHFIKI